MENKNLDLLRSGKKVFLKGSNAYEKRLYRYNIDANNLEYSDDNVNWYPSNVAIEDLCSYSLQVQN